ncbi:small acid-soluble spore protein Tlp [Paenibacillus humicola]|uniref:small acid-soluble spore protein Tlp n=1 Tax=Paenibacillus humicola TaxID=3110540 RepID=UPI00237A67A7|nr:small acid-soluble spore protein Tlp [Paenibacillus humicola]
MAKPDDRADNVEHLQQAVHNTEENLHEAQHYLDEHAEEISPKEKRDVEAKNEQRQQSMEDMKAEIKDEAKFQSRQED